MLEPLTGQVRCEMSYHYVQFCTESGEVEKMYCVLEGEVEEVIRDYLRNGPVLRDAEPLSPGNLRGWKVLSILVSPPHTLEEVEDTLDDYTYY